VSLVDDIFVVVFLELTSGEHMTSMTPDLNGQTAVVTGASRGIGRAIALRLAESGANVVATGRDADLLEGTATAIREAGGMAFPVTADLNDAGDRRRLVDAALEQFGAVDILVNNAGVNRVEPTTGVTEDTWDWIIDTNLKAVFFLTQLVAQDMLERGRGRIVNIGSEAGLKGYAEHAVYGTSKGGLVTMTKVLAVEWGGEGIRVNAVCPGATWTGMTAPAMEDPAIRDQIINRGVVGRICQPEEIAEMVAYLCGEAADMITGQVISIDGGSTAK
jgi:NAD(P)-dependent dehydrogenase (short-subunit alcohol dehydrogenase family)